MENVRYFIHFISEVVHITNLKLRDANFKFHRNLSIQSITNYNVGAHFHLTVYINFLKNLTALLSINQVILDTLYYMHKFLSLANSNTYCWLII